MKIGFIGQGWIGKHYADDFENRGYEVVRYALEAPYNTNKEKIKECEIVFVAVPTPTTPEGFSYEAVESALSVVAKGATVVIKSTLYPGTTETLQSSFPNLYIFHSPEFLRETTAAHDAAHPDRNIVGTPSQSGSHLTRAESVLNVLPSAPYNKIMPSREAELVKYAGNCFLYTKVVFMNVLYDLVKAQDLDWEVFRDALVHDPRIGESHTQPVHTSGHIQAPVASGRGAGGECFIKDFEAFRQLTTEQLSGGSKVHEVLTALMHYNNHLLRESGKDLDLLEGVYGTNMGI